MSASAEIRSAKAGRSAVRILGSEAAKDATTAARAIFREAGEVPLSRRFFARDFSSVWRDIAAGGWLTVGLPEEAGGPGFDLVDLALVAEAWGRHLIPLPFIPTLLVLRWAGKREDSPQALRLTYSLSCDGEGRVSRAVGPYLGTREVLHAARIAPLAIDIEAFEPTSSHEDARSGARGADAEAPGESWSPSMPLGSATAGTAGLPPSARMEIVVLGIAELIGCAAAMMEQTLAYARIRVQFERPIADFQAIQHLLADMHRDLEISRTALICAANEPERAARLAAFAWDRIRRIAENCIQIHGGFGYTWDAGIHYYARHVWAWYRLLRACDVPVMAC